MQIEQVRAGLENIERELHATVPGGKAGDAAWFQVLCEYVNRLPEDEAAAWRDVNSEQIVRVMWYTPEVLERICPKRRPMG